MFDPTELEALTMDELVVRKERAIRELLARDAVPAQPDDAAHQERLDALHVAVGELGLEINRRARYAGPPDVVWEAEWDETMEAQD